MIRILALGAVCLAVFILIVVLREERLQIKGKVPLGRLRKLWFRNERRIAPRYRLDWPVRYRRTDKVSNLPATTRDVSQTGAGLMVEERMEVGSEVELQFTLPTHPQPIWVISEIMWQKEVARNPSTPDNKRVFYIGVHFKGLSPKIEKELTKSLRQE